MPAYLSHLLQVRYLLKTFRIPGQKHSHLSSSRRYVSDGEVVLGKKQCPAESAQISKLCLSYFHYLKLSTCVAQINLGHACFTIHIKDAVQKLPIRKNTHVLHNAESGTIRVWGNVIEFLYTLYEVTLYCMLISFSAHCCSRFLFLKAKGVQS